MNPGKAMAIRILVHSLLFILAGAAAGYTSAALQPPAQAARSAILGAAIALGAASLNPWRMSGPRNIGRLRTLATATLVAILAAAALGHPLLAGETSSWNELISGSVERLPWCVAPAYALTMLMGYRARIAGDPRARWWFVMAAILGSAAFAASLGEPIFMLFSLFFGALPFVGLWLLAAWLTDPAWTEDRWLRRCGRDPLLHASPPHGDATAGTT